MRTLALLLACVSALTAAAPAAAQPQVPATYFGSVTVDGAPAEAGTEVRGFVGGVDCTQAAPGTRPVLRDGVTAVYVLYVVHDSQRPGCARDGSTVTFTIDGVAAKQTAPWKPGPLRLDLSAGDQPPIPLPSPTGTVASAIATATGSTASAATRAGTAATTTGATPAGAAALEGTATPSPARSPDEAEEGGGPSALVLALIAAGALAAVAGAVGVYLVGHRRAPGDA